MHLKNFWFSYKNILLSAIEVSYLKFITRIFGILYKFLIRFLRHNFSSKIVNLDNLDKENLKNLNFNELFIKFNCDKGTFLDINNKKIFTHNYSIFYEKYFSKLKEKKINLLELGSHEGKGLAAFYYYFPYSNIIGANNNPFQMKFKSHRIKELYVDVSSKKILRNLSNHLVEDLDIVIDDASHNLRDIIISFTIFFKKLNKGGIYVIEDCNQFEVFKELDPYNGKEISPKEMLIKIQNNESFSSSFINEEDKKYLLENIKDIEIKKGSMMINNVNISDIAFIFKR